MIKLDVSKTSNELFLATVGSLATTKTGKPVTVTAKDVKLVSVADDSSAPSGKNTKAVIEALADGQFVAGTSTHYLVRIALDQYYQEEDLDALVTEKTPEGITAVIIADDINTKAGTTLAPSEIKLDKTELEVKVTVINHFGLTGSVAVAIPEKKLNLTDALDSELDAFSK